MQYSFIFCLKYGGLKDSRHKGFPPKLTDFLSGLPKLSKNRSWWWQFWCVQWYCFSSIISLLLNFYCTLHSSPAQPATSSAFQTQCQSHSCSSKDFDDPPESSVWAEPLTSHCLSCCLGHLHLLSLLPTYPHNSVARKVSTHSLPSSTCFTQLA